MPLLSRLTGLVAMMIGLVAISACAPTVTGRTERMPAGQPGGAIAPGQPVTVALLAPTGAANGSTAQLGRAIVNAAQMAEADVNDPMLRVHVYDTAGNPGQAAAAARQAVADGARLILGPLFGESTRAIAGTAKGGGIEVISFSTDSTIAGGPVFLSGFLPEMAARRIISFARSRGYDSFGILYPDSGLGPVALAGAEAGAGPALVVRTSYPRTADGLPPAVEEFADRVSETGARGLLLADSGQALQYIAAILSSRDLPGPDQKYLGMGEWDSRSTLDANELIGAWFPSSDPVATKTFVDRYQQRFGNVPPRLAFLGYDAVQIAEQLLDEARRTGGAPFTRQAITRPQGFRGAVGPIRFLPDGRGQRGMAVLEVGDNVFQVVDPAPAAFGAAS